MMYIFEMAAILANFFIWALLSTSLKLGAFIFGPVMHLYWGYPQGRNYASVNNIVKVTNFFKKFTFCSFGIEAKDTKFINGTTHTHTQKYRYYTDTCIHRHIQIPFLHFTLFGSFSIHAEDTNFIFGIPQTYTCTDTKTYTHTHTYRDIDTDTDTQRHMHVCMQTQTLMCMWEI